MLLQKSNDGQRRLRKTQSASIIRGRKAAATQKSSDSGVHVEGARAAAAMAFEHAYPSYKSAIIEPAGRGNDRLPARRMTKSEGSHFARNRTNIEQKKNHSNIGKAKKDIALQPRHTRPAQTLTHRSSMKALSLCGSTPTKTYRDYQWSDSSQATKIRIRGQDSHPLRVRHNSWNSVVDRQDFASASKPGRVQQHPNENRAQPDAQSKACDARKCIAEARDQELLHHRNQGLRHLRSLMSMSFRSRPEKCQSSPTEAGDSRSDRIVTEHYASSHQQETQSSRLRGSMRGLPSSIRKLYKRSIGRDLDKSCYPSNQASTNNIQAKDHPSSLMDIEDTLLQASIHTTTAPPKPPPHLDLSSFNSQAQLASRDGVHSARQSSTYNDSHVTSWSDSSSDKTVLMRPLNGGAVKHGPLITGKPFRDNAATLDAVNVRQLPRSVPQRKSSKTFQDMPTLDAQRKISLFLKQMGPTNKLSPHGCRKTSEDMLSSTQGQHVPEVCTIRMISHTNSCNAVEAMPETTGLTGSQHIMSPSVYSRGSNGSPVEDGVVAIPSLERSLSPLGTATITDSQPVARWSLTAARQASVGDALVSSNEWRSWASRTVGGFGRSEFKCDGDPLSEGERLHKSLAMPRPDRSSLVDQRIQPAYVRSCLHERYPTLSHTPRRTSTGPLTGENQKPPASKRLNKKVEAQTTRQLADTIISALGDEPIHPLDLRKSSVINAAAPDHGKDGAPEELSDSSSVTKYREHSIPLPLTTPEFYQEYGARSPFPGSPMSENFIRRIQRGPYATPSPQSYKATGSLHASKLPRRLYTQDDAGKTPPAISREMLDDFISSRSSLVDHTLEQYSPAFL